MPHILTTDTSIKLSMLVTWAAVIKEENLHVLLFVIEPFVVNLHHTIPLMGYAASLASQEMMS